MSSWLYYSDSQYHNYPHKQMLSIWVLCVNAVLWTVKPGWPQPWCPAQRLIRLRGSLFCVIVVRIRIMQDIKLAPPPTLEPGCLNICLAALCRDLMNKDKDPRYLNVTQTPLVIYPGVKVFRWGWGVRVCMSRGVPSWVCGDDQWACSP